MDYLRKCSKPNVEREVLVSNMKSTFKRGLPYIRFGKPHSMKCAVVGGGPSVKGDLEEIRNFDGYVMAINGSYNWLLENDIIPDAVIISDALPLVADFFKNPHEDTTFLISSSCDPAVFEALKDNKILVWHKVFGDEPLEGSSCIVTGPSALTTAPFLLYMIGYREVHLFGADSSLSSSQNHVYEQDELPYKLIQVMVGTDMYMSTGPFILQAGYLWDLKEILPKDNNIIIHGYGLAKAIYENSGEYGII